VFVKADPKEESKMKVRYSLIAAFAVMSAPVFAQDAPAPSTQETSPPAQTEPMAPATPPAAEAPKATDPAPSTTPAPAAPDKEAAAPALSTSTMAAGDLKESQDDAKMVPALNASVDKVEEMDIYDANGKKIAEVDSVLEDSAGEVKGVAIEYGGFLGFGESGAILTFDQVKAQDGKLITTLSADELKTLPAWDK
jgi:sporulation protein YlmC with PRC-barrel domain